MSDEVRVTRYAKADRPAVFDLIRASHPPSTAERLIAQWDWKYDANPSNGAADPYILLLRDGFALAGMLGTIPLRLWAEDRELTISHGCDWIVHPDYRNRRIARRLVIRHRADFPLRFSWQNPISRLKSAQREDTRTVPLIPLAKVYDLAVLAAETAHRPWLARAAAAGALTARRLASLLSRPVRVPGVVVSPCEGFDDRFDRLWETAQRDRRVLLVRDRAYLQWRFGDRPDASYTTLIATHDDRLAGYLILRSAEKGGIRWGYLVDFLVERQSVALFALLAQRAAERLRNDGSKAVGCRVITPPFRRPLYRQGFLPGWWGPRGYLRINAEPTHPASARLLDAARWFLTMGDGDLELAF